MAEKPPLPPKPKPPLPSKPPRPKAAPAGAAAARPKPTTPGPPGSRPVAAPPFKKPTLAPPPQVIPLKPPPAHQYRQQQYPPGGARKQAPYRPHPHHRRRGGSGCSCRRVCCLATGLALLTLCLALAAACLAYLYYRPRSPSFHLQPLSPVRLRLGNSSSSASPVSAMDATVGARVVSWNPNERVAFRYGDGEGRVALRDANSGAGDGEGDGDVALGWAPVRGFDHAPRTVASFAFVATARGVVLDAAAAASVRDRYRRRRQGFRVVVDAHVGVRVGALRTRMVPIRLLCDDGVMAPAGSSASASDGGGTGVGPMSKCQVLLFRVRWFSLN